MSGMRGNIGFGNKQKRNSSISRSDELKRPKCFGASERATQINVYDLHSDVTDKQIPSIIFVIRSLDHEWEHCYKISHDDESGTPTLSHLSVKAECTQDSFSYQVIGSNMYSFRCNPGPRDNIPYVYLSFEHKFAKWVKTDFKLPITSGYSLFPGFYHHWLYVIGYDQDDPFTHRDGTSSVWGQVYNVDDGSEYSLDPPPSHIPKPRVLGPWKNDGLAVYSSEDNTLFVHNPVENKWNTLVVGIVEMELHGYAVYLCGNIFYTYHGYNYCLEAYDIVENKRLPKVHFDPEKDFPVDMLFLRVISDGVLCFASYEGGDFIFCSLFFIDYGSPEPKPCLMKRMSFQCVDGDFRYFCPLQS